VKDIYTKYINKRKKNYMWGRGFDVGPPLWCDPNKPKSKCINKLKLISRPNH